MSRIIFSETNPNLAMKSYIGLASESLEPKKLVTNKTSAHILELLNYEKIFQRFEEFDYLDKIDCFAGSGVSGTILVTLLSAKYNKRALFIRKESQKSIHTKSMVEGGFSSGDRILIVDDLIASGDTLKYCIDTLKTHFDTKKFTIVDCFVALSTSSIRTSFIDTFPIHYNH